MKKIGVLIADIEEMKAFLDVAEKTFGMAKEHDGIFEFETENGKIFAILAGIGKVNAAVAACKLAMTFGCEVIINEGLSGGIQARKGEIFAGSRFVEHDFDLTPLSYALGCKPEQGTFIEADADLLELVCSHFQLRSGTFGCGDGFVADSAKKQLYIELFDEIACDMESAAAAAACKELGVKFLSVRQISDSADEEASQTYSETNINQGSSLHSVVADIIKMI